MTAAGELTVRITADVSRCRESFEWAAWCVTKLVVAYYAMCGLPSW
jgi:hypothetical protein